MYQFIIVLLIILIFLFAYEVCCWLSRTYTKGVIYKKAVKQAKNTGKPLLVIGNPLGGSTDRIFGQSHGSGDLCIDITGCNGASSINYKMKAHELLRKLQDNSFIIYSSMVLEYVDEEDIDETIYHILRVGGSPDNIFLIQIQPYALTSLIYKGLYRVITHTPTFDDYNIRYTKRSPCIDLVRNTE